MLDEWRPLLCPFDTSMIEAARYFNDFLPTLVCIDQHDQTYKLWFNELIRLWLTAGNHYLLEEVNGSMYIIIFDYCTCTCTSHLLVIIYNYMYM